MKLISKIVLFIYLFSAVTLFAQEKLTLDQCVKLALKNNASIIKSKLSLDQAGLSVKQSYSNLYPTADLNASTSTSDNNVPGITWDSQWFVQGSISQDIYRPGMYSGIHLARLNRDISGISDADLAAQIRISVETALLSNIDFQRIN
ncbi:TolC family protein [candidate division KSB1 bacterium]|nr:TolC family protein [candidate division KSB1 bacterium]